jgi:hypothetical protein
MTIAFLERIEEIILAEASGASPPFPAPRASPSGKVRLGDWFDLIGGTSSGAIAAAALALGYSVGELRDFFLRVTPRAFKRSFFRIPGVQSRFDFRGLTNEIEAIVKDSTLDSPHLITGLAIIAKRLDTGSPWIVTNNSRAAFWNDPPNLSYIGNKHYRLVHLLRASNAGSHYFDPEILPIMGESEEVPFSGRNLPNWPFLSVLLNRFRALYSIKKGNWRPDRHGLFIDGGMTPFNNPALALLMQAVLKQYRICWPLGPENLTIVSIGAGASRAKFSLKEVGFGGPLRWCFGALLSLMRDNEPFALTQLQWLGESLTPWPINSEIGAVSGNSPPGGAWFRFARYDVRLERDWLEKLGVSLSDKEVTRLQNIDDPGVIETAYEIARLAARQQVKPEHFFPVAQNMRAEHAS